MTPSILLSTAIAISTGTYTPVMLRNVAHVSSSNGADQFRVQKYDGHRLRKTVVLHGDGRITWHGGFKTDREVIRFLMETENLIYSTRKP